MARRRTIADAEKVLDERIADVKKRVTEIGNRADALQVEHDKGVAVLSELVNAREQLDAIGDNGQDDDEPEETAVG